MILELGRTCSFTRQKNNTSGCVKEIFSHSKCHCPSFTHSCYVSFVSSKTIFSIHSKDSFFISTCKSVCQILRIVKTDDNVFFYCKKFSSKHLMHDFPFTFASSLYSGPTCNTLLPCASYIFAMICLVCIILLLCNISVHFHIVLLLEYRGFMLIRFK